MNSGRHRGQKSHGQVGRCLSGLCKILVLGGLEGCTIMQFCQPRWLNPVKKDE
jgi:hypothetical protein